MKNQSAGINNKMQILGYSERGLINSLFFEMKNSRRGALLLSQFVSLANFQSGEKDFRLENDSILLIEQSFSDFGDADAVLLINIDGSGHSIFFEAKVKTSLRKTWSIREEFNEFEMGIKSKVSSSNLFMQLYLKQALMKGLQEKGIIGLQTEGIPFPLCSSKRSRKLGNNEVVRKAAEILKSHSQSAHYIAIVPDEAHSVGCFFDEELRKCHPDGFEYWNTDDWGYITWSEIEDFCKKHHLTGTVGTFKHNKGQIY